MVMSTKGKVLKPDFKIIDRNEPAEIIEAFYQELADNLLLYGLEDDYRMRLAFEHLQTSILYWHFYLED